MNAMIPSVIIIAATIQLYPPEVYARGMTVATMLLCAVSAPGARSAAPADRRFAVYGELLGRVVHGAEVDYRAILGDRTTLDRIVAEFAEVPAATENGWEGRDRMAFWINAYNLFTLRAIVDHYPIRGSWFSRAPRNSIRQIDGVWTTLTWRASGRDLQHFVGRTQLADFGARIQRLASGL